MSTSPLAALPDRDGAFGFAAVPTSHYSYKELADIYNQTRVDYLVPMPMNAKRMEEYVRYYDVDLDHSYVAIAPDHEIAGIAMLGLRDDRAWITRLGVIPNERRRGTGQFLMDQLMNAAQATGARRVQLEVIKGNEPAHKLFLKNGFYEIRELLIIRRPPGQPDADPQLDPAEVSPMNAAEIRAFLNSCNENVAWLEESRSLLNAGHLQGLQVTLPDGISGQIVFHQTVFQLTHFVLDPAARDSYRLAKALLYHLHQQNAMQDTKVENLPVDDPVWAAFQVMGYVEVFRRIEMYCDLA